MPLLQRTLEDLEAAGTGEEAMDGVDGSGVAEATRQLALAQMRSFSRSVTAHVRELCLAGPLLACLDELHVADGDVRSAVLGPLLLG